MNRIKELRNNKNMTLDELSKFTEIKRGTLNNYELGKTEPKLETWQKLADYFNVSVPYIMGIDDESELTTELKIDKSSMSKVIKQIIDEKQITPKEFGKMLHPAVSEDTILDWINGKSFSTHHLNQISKIAGISFTRFISGMSEQEEKRYENILDFTDINHELLNQKNNIADEKIKYTQDLDDFVEFYNTLIDNKEFDKLETIAKLFDVIQKAYKN